MTHPSKSKTRSVAAIGNGCVIPAKAGIHFATVKSQWIPAFAGMTSVEVVGLAHPSKSKTRSVAATGNACVIPAKTSPKGEVSRNGQAGIHFATVKSQWIPAFAGMTNSKRPARN